MTTSDIKTLLNLRVPPVAVGFFNEAPAGVERLEDGPAPSGCTFWQYAQAGNVFYTEPDDHGCAVGLHTHNLPQPASADLPGTLSLMAETQYVEPEEVADIPTMAQSSSVVAYGPAEAGAFEPTVVIVAAEPARAMLIFEAAVRAGVSSLAAPIVGRPGCAVIPQTANDSQVAMSFGCIGNRTYTGLEESELYISVPGDQWGKVVDALGEIVEANATMQSHYESTL
jgi:uncharacterized protein (DUF169 family)